MKVSLKLGGHVLFNEKAEPLIERFKEYGEVLRKLLQAEHEVHVVVGGGPPSRRYIEAARSMGASEAMCDEMGISISRLNALLLLSTIKDLSHPSIPTSYDELKLALSSRKTVICGGLQPGQSTVAVAALMAELMKADMLVVATDVDGIYTEDPKRSAKARKLERLSYRELRELMMSEEAKAGTFKLFDQTSIKLIERSRTPTVVIDGRDPANVLKLLIEGKPIGTYVS